MTTLSGKLIMGGGGRLRRHCEVKGRGKTPVLLGEQIHSTRHQKSQGKPEKT